MSRRKSLAIHKGVEYYRVMRKRRLPAEIREYFVKMGRIGGQKGLAARMEKVGPERRREIAQRAIATRWAKARGNA
jgi:predicted metalloprotease